MIVKPKLCEGIWDLAVLPAFVAVFLDDLSKIRDIRADNPDYGPYVIKTLARPKMSILKLFTTPLESMNIVA